MDASRFDRIARLLADRRLSRRQAIVGFTAAAATSAVGMGVSRAAAQEDLPVASPMADVEKTTYLFVQSFQKGSLAPNADGETHALTLEQGLGQTLYFGDRPSRDVGMSPTETFLEGLGFSDDNPPNAALIVDAGDGETDLAVLELFNPTYDVATHTATYQVRGLEAWEDSLELGLQDQPSDLSGLTPIFGAAHLLIDDCADGPIGCYSDPEMTNLVGMFQDQPMCYAVYGACVTCEPQNGTNPEQCFPSEFWNEQCGERYEVGEGRLFSYFTNADLLNCNYGSRPADW